MLGRNLLTLNKIFLALFVLLLVANSALAYVGPGADLAFISYAMTLLAWGLAAFSAVLLWPVYALIRKIRGVKKKPLPAAPTETASPSPIETSAENAGAVNTSITLAQNAITRIEPTPEEASAASPAQP